MTRVAKWSAAIVVAGSAAGLVSLVFKYPEFRETVATRIDRFLGKVPDAVVVGPPPAANVSCPSKALAAFPWPNPPHPTNDDRIVRSNFDLPSKATPTTLGEFRTFLSDRVRAAGYVDRPVLGVGCSGFAIVLPTERLDPEGKRVAGPDGFAEPGQQSRFRLSDTLWSLLSGQSGYFRTIVLVVTNEPLQTYSDPFSRDELRLLGQRGADELPKPLAEAHLSNEYKIYALVYEFEAVRGVEAARRYRTEDVSAGWRAIGKNVPVFVDEIDDKGVTRLKAFAIQTPPRGRQTALVHLAKAGLVHVKFAKS